MAFKSKTWQSYSAHKKKQLVSMLRYTINPATGCQLTFDQIAAQLCAGSRQNVEQIFRSWLYGKHKKKLKKVLDSSNITCYNIIEDKDKAHSQPRDQA